MPDQLGHDLLIVLRILLGLLGALAFYIALFMYEDEQGRWQNKLELLWMSVYDRAKSTDTTTTALFNKIAQLLVSTSNRVFSERLISLHMTVVSTVLSFAGGALHFLVLEIIPPRDEDSTFLWPLLGFVFISAIAFVVIKFARLWIDILVTVAFCSLFAQMMFMFFSHLQPDEDVFLRLESGRNVSLLLTLPIILSTSTIADADCVVALRRIFISVADTISLSRVIIMCLLTAGLFLAVLPVPLYILRTIRDHSDDQDVVAFASNGFLWLIFLNGSTALYCVIPVILLLGVIGHKLLWPALSRALYSACRYKLISNNKVLSSVGCLALTYAFNLAPVGFKDILKLFK